MLIRTVLGMNKFNIDMGKRIMTKGHSSFFVGNFVFTFSKICYSKVRKKGKR